MLSKLLVAGLMSFPSFAANDTETKQLTLDVKNTVVFRGAVDGGSITAAQLQLAELVTKRGAKSYPLYLVLDSPGGSIIAGDAFIQFAKTIKGLHTVSIFAASMASAIAQAIPGKRYVTENGLIMFHRAKGGFEGQFEDGEVETQLALFKAIVRSLEQRNADRLKISLVAYKEKVKDEYWTYGAKNVAEGTADAVIDIVCTKALIDSRIVKISGSIFGPLDLEFSGCPLFRVPVPQQQETPNEDS